MWNLAKILTTSPTIPQDDGLSLVSSDSCSSSLGLSDHTEAHVIYRAASVPILTTATTAGGG